MADSPDTTAIRSKMRAAGGQAWQMARAARKPEKKVGSGVLTVGAAGIAACLSGVTETSAWKIFLILFAAVTIGTYFLQAIADQLVRAIDSRAPIAVAGLVIGLGIEALGLAVPSRMLLFLGPVVFTASGVTLHRLMSKSAPGEGAAWLWGGGVALVFAMVLIPRPPLGATVSGIVLWLGGLTAMKLGVSAYIVRSSGTQSLGWAETVSGRAQRLLVASVGAVAVGIVLLTVGGVRDRVGDGPVATTIAITLVFGGLSFAGIAAMHLLPDLHWNDGFRSGSLPPPSTKVWLATAVVGVVIGAIAFAWTSSVISGWTAAVYAITLIFFFLGAFFVLRGELLWALLLIGSLVAWGYIGRTAEPTLVSAAESDGIVLAFGDSFTSGQGAEVYMAGTNTQSPSGNDCRRSPVAYPFLLGYQLNREVLSVACSGAETEHITTVGQKVDSQDATSTVPGRETQIAEAEKALGDRMADVDLVLVGIGGNDAEFSTVVTACVLPSNCSLQRPQFLTQAQLIAADIAATYQALRGIEGLPATTPIVVIPYPSYVGDSACDRSFTDDELDFAVEFIRTVNRQIDWAAGEVNDPHLHVFEEVDEAFAGRRICDSEVDDAANFIQLVPKEGSVFQRINPSKWHDGSMHPNEIGHECLAVHLERFLSGAPFSFDVSVDRSATAPTCVPVGGVSSPVEFVAGDDEVLGISQSEPAKVIPRPDDGLNGASGVCVAAVDDISDEGGACFSGQAWALAQLRTTVARVSLPFSMLVLSGLLVALGVGRLRPSLLDPLLPDPPRRVG